MVMGLIWCKPKAGNLAETLYSFLI